MNNVSSLCGWSMKEMSWWNTDWSFIKRNRQPAFDFV